MKMKEKADFQDANLLFQDTDSQIDYWCEA